MSSSNNIDLLEKGILSSKEKVIQMMDFDSLWSEHEQKKEESNSFYSGLMDTFDVRVLKRTLFVFSAILFFGLLLIQEEPSPKKKNTSVVKSDLDTQFHMASPYSSDQPFQLKSMVFSLEE